MKRLILLRHAKAVGQGAAPDRDRVLADKGRADMEAVAAHLKAAALHPDLALVSPAARAQETWSLTGLDGETDRADERIYEASADELLGIIRDAEPALGSLMLVGHNPGLEALGIELVRDGPEPGLARLREGFSTAGVAIIDFDIDEWSRVGPRTGRLVSFETPGSLGTNAGRR